MGWWVYFAIGVACGFAAAYLLAAIAMIKQARERAHLVRKDPWA